jgi:hypothetical protein
MHAPQDNPFVCNDANSGSAIEAFVYRPGVEMRREVLFSHFRNFFMPTAKIAKSYRKRKSIFDTIFMEIATRKSLFYNLILEISSVAQINCMIFAKNKKFDAKISRAKFSRVLLKFAFVSTLARRDVFAKNQQKMVLLRC